MAASLGPVEHTVLEIDLRTFGGSALTDDIDVPKDVLQDRDRRRKLAAGLEKLARRLREEGPENT